MLTDFKDEDFDNKIKFRFCAFECIGFASGTVKQRQNSMENMRACKHAPLEELNDESKI